MGVLNTLETRWTVAPAALEVRVLYSPLVSPARLLKAVLTVKTAWNSVELRLKRVHEIAKALGNQSLSYLVRCAELALHQSLVQLMQPS